MLFSSLETDQMNVMKVAGYRIIIKPNIPVGHNKLTKNPERIFTNC